MDYGFTDLNFEDFQDTPEEVNIPGNSEEGNDPSNPTQGNNDDSSQESEEDTIDNNNADTPDDENPSDPEEEQDDDSNQSTLSVFAQSLKEGGVFAGIDDDKIQKVNSVEDLLKLMDESLNKKKFEGLTLTQQRYLESLEAGVSKSEFDQIEKELSYIESITDEALENNPQLQFNMIGLGLMEQGISKEKASKIANSMMASGNGLAEALESKEQLYKIKEQKFKESIEAKKQDTKLSVEKTKELVDGKKDVLSSVPLTTADKETIFRRMTTKVDVNENGEPINRFTQWRKENGVEAEFIINALFTLTNEFKDLGRLGEVAKTKAAMKLDKMLKQNESNDLNNQGSGFKLNDSDPYNINV